MSGTTVPPASALPEPVMLSLMNSLRVAAVSDLLLSNLQSGRQNNDKEIFDLCLSLSRGIDFALANSEIPDKAQELPCLLKQLCQRKNDLFLQAAVMVLMISVKNACKIGWFPEMETQELLTLAYEKASSFCSTGDDQTEPSDFHSTISMIVGRFYPLMKIGQILASLEVKPGFGAYVVDFHITKTIRHSSLEKIHLLVVQTDNIETSACITSPQQVNFLLNGKGVGGRSGDLVDHGPQLPTNVNGMLKYGTNLLQAVGQFDGHCIIILAFMSISTLPEVPVLEDYVPSGGPLTDLDNDIIEGPSRTSLKCPISLRRMAIPVKGCRCKHVQCFDFSNYVHINLRRPSWRCPHCNQHVCYTELRIDQNMAKVLREVGEDVTDVMISVDGSWKAVLERDDNEDVLHDEELHHANKKLRCEESTVDSGPGSIFLDLTEDNDMMDDVGSYKNEDRETVCTDLQTPATAAYFTTLSDLNNINVSNQNAAARIVDDFWSSNAPVTSHVSSDAQIRNSTANSAAAHFLMSPILTDSVLPACNREAEEHANINLTISAVQTQFSAPGNLVLQQTQNLDSVSVQNEYGQSASAPRNITRTPVAVQALPAFSQTPEKRASSIDTSPSLASQSSLSVACSVNNCSMISDVVQNASIQGHTSMGSQSVQQATGIQASSLFPANNNWTEFRNPHLQQALNLRMPKDRSQSSSFPRTHVQLGAVQVGVGQLAGAGHSQPGRFASAISQAAQMATQSPSVATQIQKARPASSYPINPDGARASMADQRGSVGGRMQPVSRADGLVDLQSEQNRQPVSRMRGSLSGAAYYAALKQYMNLPNQPAQARASPNVTSPTSRVPPHLQAFFANRSFPTSLQSQNTPRGGAAGTSGLSSVPSANATGMN